MTVTDLSKSPLSLSGLISTVGSFTIGPFKCPPVAIVEGFSPLFGFVTVTFDASATGSVTLSKSYDDVNYTPLTNVQDGSQIGVLTGSGTMTFLAVDGVTSWQITGALTAVDPPATATSPKKGITYSIGTGTPARLTFPDRYSNQGSIDLRTRYTTAQIQQMASLQAAGLTASDITGNLTLYKRCRGGTFAKLLVPSAVARAIATTDRNDAREIKAVSANVVSTFDSNGNAVSGATSYVDPVTVYRPGQTVTSRAIDSRFSASLPFSDSANTIGIYGYLTLFEAVVMQRNDFL